MKLKLTPRQLNRHLVEIMTGITLLILIVFAIFVTSHVTKISWGIIMFDVGIGLITVGIILRLVLDYDDTPLLLPAGFIFSLMMYSGFGFFYFAAANKVLDIAVKILPVLWLIVGYKCFYDRNKGKK